MGTLAYSTCFPIRIDQGTACCCIKVQAYAGADVGIGAFGAEIVGHRTLVGDIECGKCTACVDLIFECKIEEPKSILSNGPSRDGFNPSACRQLRAITGIVTHQGLRELGAAYIRTSVREAGLGREISVVTFTRCSQPGQGEPTQIKINRNASVSCVDGVPLVHCRKCAHRIPFRIAQKQRQASTFLNLQTGSRSTGHAGIKKCPLFQTRVQIKLKAQAMGQRPDKGTPKQDVPFLRMHQVERGRPVCDRRQSGLSCSRKRTDNNACPYGNNRRKKRYPHRTKPSLKQDKLRAGPGLASPSARTIGLVKSLRP